MDFLMTHKYVIFLLAAVVAAILIASLCVIFKRRKKRKDELEMSRLHRRNEALAEALKNPMSKGKSDGKGGGPLEISWDAKAVNESAPEGAGAMFEITELSEYSKKRYIFRADKPVTIGSDEDNQLVIFKDGVSGKHCIIETSNGKPCVRAIRGERATLCRGKKTAAISENGLILNNGDKIEMGSAVIQFRSFKS